MKTYDYVAAGTDGTLISGRAWAGSELELDGDLESRGLVLTRAREVANERKNKNLRLKTDHLIGLTTQLATVTSAGVRIVEGLEGIGARMESASGRRLVEEMVASLRAGASLSESMERHPRAFPEVFRASVKAGEASGALDTVLLSMAKYLEWTRGIRATTMQAMIYPVILFVALAGLVLTLVYWVLPKIILLFPGGREDLPAETQAVMAFSDFLRDHALLLGLTAVGAIIGLPILFRRKAPRRALHSFALRLPKLGGIARQIATSKFASTAAILQKAGCDVFTVLDVSAATCGNAALAASFARTSEGVRRGLTITQGLEREPQVDPLLTQLVSVGEQTGAMDQCLARLVAYYDDEIPRAVKRFLSLLEPAMLLGAGMVVAFILLAALLPIFDLMDKLG